MSPFTNPTLGALAIGALLAASGCSSLSMKSQPDRVPADLVPDGYTAGECHYAEQSDGGGAGGGFGGLPSSTRRSVSCQHAPPPAALEEHCFVNGEQKPLDQCKQGATAQ
jgi:hypothetical protein